MRIVTWLLTNAAAVAVAAWLLPGIWFDGASSPFTDEVADKFVPVVVVGLILGLVSAIVEPVVKFLSLPFIIVTIGLFLLVINALMLLLTEWIANRFDVGFTVDGFWWAVAGSIVITVVVGFINLVAIDDD